MMVTKFKVAAVEMMGIYCIWDEKYEWLAFLGLGSHSFDLSPDKILSRSTSSSILCTLTIDLHSVLSKE